MTIDLESTAAAPPAVASARPVRVWSPVTVAVYGLVLGYPAGIALALRNWRALGLRREVWVHLLGALLFSVLFIGIFLFVPKRARRIFGLAANVGAFIYLKAKLQSDLEDVKTADPNLVVGHRRWYAGLGWVFVAYVVFFLVICLLVMVAMAAGLLAPH